MNNGYVDVGAGCSWFILASYYSCRPIWVILFLSRTKISYTSDVCRFHLICSRMQCGGNYEICTCAYHDITPFPSTLPPWHPFYEIGLRYPRIDSNRRSLSLAHASEHVHTFMPHSSWKNSSNSTKQKELNRFVQFLIQPCKAAGINSSLEFMYSYPTLDMEWIDDTTAFHLCEKIQQILRHTYRRLLF